MTSVDLEHLLSSAEGGAREELESMPRVVEKNENFDIDKLPIQAREWHSIDDVVVVVADLKNSTKLGTGRRAQSTASIYQASTGGVVQIFNEFDADFIAIQGDGAFAIFWGEMRFERALCAGVTVKTFGVDLRKRLEKKWPNGLPETGLKVGIASGRVLVKRVGVPRNPANQEPVWAGKAVNYAVKAAQLAEADELVVTGSVWDLVEKNDYLSTSCSCSAPSIDIWRNVEIAKLPDEEPEAQGRLLESSWCEVHGAEYCKAILGGRTEREDVRLLRKQVRLSQMDSAIRKKASGERASRLARRRGLAR